jgi:AraC-like DNA-binding protein
LDLDADRQFAAWQEYMMPLIDLRLPDQAEDNEPFPVHQVVWNLEGVLLIRQKSPAFSFVRSAEKVRFSAIDHWKLTFLHTGKTWTNTNGGVLENEPGMVEICNLGCPFYGRSLEGQSVTLILPRDLFASYGGLPNIDGGIVLGGERIALLFSYVEHLEANIDRLTKSDLPGIRNQLRDTIFETVASLENYRRDGEAAQSGLMTRARQFIQDNLHSTNLTPEILSRELAISRTRLYELFQTSGGVLNYIRRKRLLAAHSALGDPANSLKIAAIANRFGFDSAANFCRAFTHEFGYNPSEVRRHSGKCEMGSSLRAREASTFTGWLSTLGL